MAFGKKLNLIPTASLLRAVQDPKYAVSIDVPGYAALDELQQRKVKGENLKLAMAEMPKQTVKDEVLAEYQPGLPSPQMASAPVEMPQQPMPQPQMPVEQPMPEQPMPTMMAAEGGIIDIPAQYNPLPESSYARGGIVSFAGGGLNVPQFQVPEAPTFDTSFYDQFMIANPLQTREQVAEEEEKRRQRQGINIKEMYRRQMEGLAEEKEEVKKSFDTNKALAGLEMAGEMLKSTSPFFGPGIGAGTSAFAKSYGAAEKEMRSANRQLRREENAMDVAKTNMQLAINKGDDDMYNQNFNRYQNAATAKQALQNKTKELQYSGQLKKSEEEYGFKKATTVAGMQAAASHNTDMNRLIEGQYQELLANGYPADAKTKALAQRRAYDIAGKASGSSKFSLDEFLAMTKLEKDKQERIDKAEANKNTPLGAAKLNLIRVQNTTKDPAKIEAANKAYEEEKAKLVKPIEDAFNKVREQYKKPDIGDIPPYQAPEVPMPPKPAGAKETGAGGVKPVQSKFVEDGFVFPNKAALDAYRKAKAAK